MYQTNQNAIIPYGSNKPQAYHPNYPNNMVITYLQDPRTRIPNPMFPIRIVRSELQSPIIMMPSEPIYQHSPQVAFWLKKPAPSWKQLIKAWLNR